MGKPVASPATLPASATARTAEAPRPTSPAAFALGTRFVDFEIASTRFFAVKPRDRLRRLVIIRHFDERKASRPARVAVHGNVHPRDLSKRLEQRAQIALGHLKAHIPHKNTLHLFLLLHGTAAVGAAASPQINKLRFRIG